MVTTRAQSGKVSGLGSDGRPLHGSGMDVNGRSIKRPPTAGKRPNEQVFVTESEETYVGASMSRPWKAEEIASVQLLEAAATSDTEPALGSPVYQDTLTEEHLYSYPSPSSKEAIYAVNKAGTKEERVEQINPVHGSESFVIKEGLRGLASSPTPTPRSNEPATPPRSVVHKTETHSSSKPGIPSKSVDLETEIHTASKTEAYTPQNPPVPVPGSDSVCRALHTSYMQFRWVILGCVLPVLVAILLFWALVPRYTQQQQTSTAASRIQPFRDVLSQVVDASSAWQDYLIDFPSKCSHERPKACGVLLVCQQDINCQHAMDKIVAAPGMTMDQIITLDNDTLHEDAAGSLQEKLCAMVWKNPTSVILLKGHPTMHTAPVLANFLSEGGQLSWNGKDVKTSSATVVMFLEATMGEVGILSFEKSSKDKFIEKMALASGSSNNDQKGIFGSFSRRLNVIAPIREAIFDTQMM